MCSQPIIQQKARCRRPAPAIVTHATQAPTGFLFFCNIGRIRDSGDAVGGGDSTTVVCDGVLGSAKEVVVTDEG